MIFGKCTRCGCSLDAGEGRVCEECKEDMSVENRRKQELDSMVRSTNYKQIEMEDLLNGKNKVM